MSDEMPEYFFWRNKRHIVSRQSVLPTGKLVLLGRWRLDGRIVRLHRVKSEQFTPAEIEEIREAFMEPEGDMTSDEIDQRIWEIFVVDQLPPRDVLARQVRVLIDEALAAQKNRAVEIAVF